MNRYIDIYCERLAPGLWAEPVNAVTNASFFVAALFAWFLLNRTQKTSLRGAGGDAAIQSGTGGSGLLRSRLFPRNDDIGAYLLIFLTFAMGVGSTLFHTFAVRWAMLADVLPILLYQIVFIAVYSARVIKLRMGAIFILLGLFFLSMYGSMQLPREWLNGSLEYAPAWLFVFALGIYHLKNASREKFGLLLARGVFTVSLTFRSFDMAICESWPLGTHFMWHILNGLVLYLTSRAYILNASKN